MNFLLHYVGERELTPQTYVHMGTDAPNRVTDLCQAPRTVFAAGGAGVWGSPGDERKSWREACVSAVRGKGFSHCCTFHRLKLSREESTPTESRPGTRVRVELPAFPGRRGWSPVSPPRHLSFSPSSERVGPPGPRVVCGGQQVPHDGREARGRLQVMLDVESRQEVVLRGP